MGSAPFHRVGGDRGIAWIRCGSLCFRGGKRACVLRLGDRRRRGGFRKYWEKRRCTSVPPALDGDHGAARRESFRPSALAKPDGGIGPDEFSDRPRHGEQRHPIFSFQPAETFTFPRSCTEGFLSGKPPARLLGHLHVQRRRSRSERLHLPATAQKVFCRRLPRQSRATPTPALAEPDLSGNG